MRQGCELAARLEGGKRLGILAFLFFFFFLEMPEGWRQLSGLLAKPTLSLFFSIFLFNPNFFAAPSELPLRRDHVHDP